MLFNSYIFLLAFLPITIAVFGILNYWKYHELAIIWLGLVSIFFYSWSNFALTAFLLFSIAVNAGFGMCLILLKIESYLRRFLLIGGVAFNLGLMAYFKYSGFIVLNINQLLGTHITLEKVILPLGISFFTFQQIGYLVDAYQGKLKTFKLSEYVLFVTFFPQLIAGPLVHHKEMMPQFLSSSIKQFNFFNLAIGLSIFAVGLFKKTILADISSHWVDPGFTAISQGTVIDPATAWVAALCYSFQLYFDFSGYSDMALGTARMFNIILPLNFNSPYKAIDLVDFWRRWHITLSRFLRDYLYIPLGGNRKGQRRRYLNLFIVMLLCGLWHGAAWTFVIWGGVHGILLIVNHGWHHLQNKLDQWLKIHIQVPRIIPCLVTFIIVVSTWVIFRADSLKSAFRFLKSMYGFNGTPLSYSLKDFIVTQIEQVGKVQHLLSAWFTSTQLTDAQSLNLGDINLVGVWLLILAVIVFFAPNTYDIFKDYNPALVDNPSALSPANSKFTWNLSLSMAGLIAVLITASVLQLSTLSPFLYFQF